VTPFSISAEKVVVALDGIHLREIAAQILCDSRHTTRPGTTHLAPGRMPAGSILSQQKVRHNHFVDWQGHLPVRAFLLTVVLILLGLFPVVCGLGFGK
jgi:hypothetical protein